MFGKFKTRAGKLEEKLQLELATAKPDIRSLMKSVEEFHKDNLLTIDKLKKEKRVDVVRINGALKQTIHAHGPITKELIGSASKRIYGALLLNPSETSSNNKISFTSVLIGIVIGVIVTLIIT